MLRTSPAFLLALCLWSLSARAADAQAPALTDDEQKAGWKLLFDGATTKGWRGLGAKEFPTQGWDVVDGCLHHKPKGGGGDITPDGAVENFELSIEWKIAPGGNSGIKYRVAESPGQKSAFGCEYQILDDERCPEGKKGKVSAASLYDVLPPNEKKKLKPAGEFNQTRILVQGDHAEHWLNGEKVVEYDFGSEAWKAAVAQGKFKNNPKYGAAGKAQIALQDHSDEVWFRNIKVRELPAK
ncbi:MAG: DUF1080 domain-containing protein [Planctomycetota bacterium]|nr:DUF1080 domain-containing protein [Planctomycetota bacterium]